MQVTLNFYATFRQLTGQKAIVFEIEAPTQVLGLIQDVCAKYPALKSHLFEMDGSLQGHIHLFLNKRDITFLEDGLETLLMPGDTLDIFPPVGGG